MQAVERILNRGKARGIRLLRESLDRFLNIKIATRSLAQELPDQAQTFRENIEGLEVGSSKDRAQRFYQENWLRPRPYTIRNLVGLISSFRRR